MDSLLTRYRNITVLLLVIVAQLLLLAYQVRNNQDVRLIRVWAVTAVTPVARAIEALRSTVAGWVENYFTLRDIRGEYRRTREELGRIKMENQFLKAELATAERARALAVFQSRTPSRTLASRVIGTGAGSGSSVRFLDRGSAAGVQKGMAVVTPDGIVGKVTAVFPYASQILLITDSNLGAGVISQKNRVRGTLRGLGYGNCRVDQVPSEAKVEVGEWFYTSGEDRVFPKGLPAGRVRSVRPGQGTFQEVLLDPSGLESGVEEVLIVLEGVHQQIPDQPATGGPIYLAPPPPSEPPDPTLAPAPAAPGTDADRLRERYKAVGEAQGHQFGEGGPGSKPPDFNLPPPLRPSAGPPPTPEAKPPAPAAVR